MSSRNHGPKLPAQPAAPTLVGKFFHSFDDAGVTHWQGRVIEEVAPGVYLCGLFEWLMGTEDTRVLIRLDDMLASFGADGVRRVGFHFYSSAEETTDKYNRVLYHKDEWKRRQAEKHPAA